MSRFWNARDFSTFATAMTNMVRFPKRASFSFAATLLLLTPLAAMTFGANNNLVVNAFAQQSNTRSIIPQLQSNMNASEVSPPQNSTTAMGPLLLQNNSMLNASASTLTFAPLPWSLGWDVFGERLNLETSRISFNVTSHRGELILDYNLSGARANDAYLVGFHLLWPFTAQCIPTFGQINGSPLTQSNCFTATRQGNTRSYEVFELGNVTTDSSGNGAKQFTIENVPSGTYEAEFHIRNCADCSGNSPQNVIFQSPGPTYGAKGSTVYFTIP
jgi:hypothetical protein